MGIPDRQLLVVTALLSFIAVIITLVGSGGDWVAALIALPLFATISFWSFRVSRWASNRIAPRPQVLEPPPATEPTSARPEHARRRRRRGGRR